jgi:hypothetical protein
MAKILDDVYFFRGRELAEKLNLGEVSDYVVMKNFVVYSLVAGIGLTVPLSSSADQISSDAIF